MVTLVPEIKHIALDLKEIKSPGQSLSQQELLLSQHQQELSQVSKMIEDVTALDRKFIG